MSTSSLSPSSSFKRLQRVPTISLSQFRIRRSMVGIKSTAAYTLRRNYIIPKSADILKSALSNGTEDMLKFLFKHSKPETCRHDLDSFKTNTRYKIFIPIVDPKIWRPLISWYEKKFKNYGKQNTIIATNIMCTTEMSSQKERMTVQSAKGYASDLGIDIQCTMAVCINKAKSIADTANKENCDFIFIGIDPGIESPSLTYKLIKEIIAITSVPVVSIPLNPEYIKEDTEGPKKSKTKTDEKDLKKAKKSKSPPSCQSLNFFKQCSPTRAKSPPKKSSLSPTKKESKSPISHENTSAAKSKGSKKGKGGKSMKKTSSKKSNKSKGSSKGGKKPKKAKSVKKSSSKKSGKGKGSKSEGKSKKGKKDSVKKAGAPKKSKSDKSVKKKGSKSKKDSVKKSPSKKKSKGSPKSSKSEGKKGKKKGAAKKGSKSPKSSKSDSKKGGKKKNSKKKSSTGGEGKSKKGGKKKDSTKGKKGSKKDSAKAGKGKKKDSTKSKGKKGKKDSASGKKSGGKGKKSKKSSPIETKNAKSDVMENVTAQLQNRGGSRGAGLLQKSAAMAAKKIENGSSEDKFGSKSPSPMPMALKSPEKSPDAKSPEKSKSPLDSPSPPKATQPPASAKDSGFGSSVFGAGKDPSPDPFDFPFGKSDDSLDLDLFIANAAAKKRAADLENANKFGGSPKKASSKSSDFGFKPKPKDEPSPYSPYSPITATTTIPDATTTAATTKKKSSSSSSSSSSSAKKNKKSKSKSPVPKAVESVKTSFGSPPKSPFTKTSFSSPPKSPAANTSVGSPPKQREFRGFSPIKSQSKSSSPKPKASSPVKPQSPPRKASSPVKSKSDSAKSIPAWAKKEPSKAASIKSNSPPKAEPFRKSSSFKSRKSIKATPTNEARESVSLKQTSRKNSEDQFYQPIQGKASQKSPEKSSRSVSKFVNGMISSAAKAVSPEVEKSKTEVSKGITSKQMSKSQAHKTPPSKQSTVRRQSSSAAAKPLSRDKTQSPSQRASPTPSPSASPAKNVPASSRKPSSPPTQKSTVSHKPSISSNKKTKITSNATQSRAGSKVKTSPTAKNRSLPNSDYTYTKSGAKTAKRTDVIDSVKANEIFDVDKNDSRSDAGNAKGEFPISKSKGNKKQGSDTDDASETLDDVSHCIPKEILNETVQKPKKASSPPVSTGSPKGTTSSKRNKEYKVESIFQPKSPPLSPEKNKKVKKQPTPQHRSSSKSQHSRKRSAEPKKQAAFGRSSTVKFNKDTKTSMRSITQKGLTIGQLSHESLCKHIYLNTSVSSRIYTISTDDKPPSKKRVLLFPVFNIGVCKLLVVWYIQYFQKPNDLVVFAVIIKRAQATDEIYSGRDFVAGKVPLLKNQLDDVVALKEFVDQFSFPYECYIGIGPNKAKIITDTATSKDVDIILVGIADFNKNLINEAVYLIQGVTAFTPYPVMSIPLYLDIHCYKTGGAKSPKQKLKLSSAYNDDKPYPYNRKELSPSLTLSTESASSPDVTSLTSPSPSLNQMGGSSKSTSFMRLMNKFLNMTMSRGMISPTFMSKDKRLWQLADVQGRVKFILKNKPQESDVRISSEKRISSTYEILMKIKNKDKNISIKHIPSRVMPSEAESHLYTAFSKSSEVECSKSSLDIFNESRDNAGVQKTFKNSNPAIQRQFINSKSINPSGHSERFSESTTETISDIETRTATIRSKSTTKNRGKGKSPLSSRGSKSSIYSDYTGAKSKLSKFSMASPSQRSKIISNRTNKSVPNDRKSIITRSRKNSKPISSRRDRPSQSNKKYTDRKSKKDNNLSSDETTTISKDGQGCFTNSYYQNEDPSYSGYKPTDNKPENYKSLTVSPSEQYGIDRNDELISVITISSDKSETETQQRNAKNSNLKHSRYSSKSGLLHGRVTEESESDSRGYTTRSSLRKKPKSHRSRSTTPKRSRSKASRSRSRTPHGGSRSKSRTPHSSPNSIRKSIPREGSSNRKKSSRKDSRTHQSSERKSPSRGIESENRSVRKSVQRDRSESDSFLDYYDSEKRPTKQGNEGRSLSRGYNSKKSRTDNKPGVSKVYGSQHSAPGGATYNSQHRRKSVETVSHSKFDSDETSIPMNDRNTQFRGKSISKDETISKDPRYRNWPDSELNKKFDSRRTRDGSSRQMTNVKMIEEGSTISSPDREFRKESQAVSVVRTKDDYIPQTSRNISRGSKRPRPNPDYGYEDDETSRNILQSGRNSIIDNPSSWNEGEMVTFPLNNEKSTHYSTKRSVPSKRGVNSPNDFSERSGGIKYRSTGGAGNSRNLKKSSSKSSKGRSEFDSIGSTIHDRYDYDSRSIPLKQTDTKRNIPRYVSQKSQRNMPLDRKYSDEQSSFQSTIHQSGPTAKSRNDASYANSRFDQESKTLPLDYDAYNARVRSQKFANGRSKKGVRSLGLSCSEKPHLGSIRSKKFSADNSTDNSMCSPLDEEGGFYSQKLQKGGQDVRNSHGQNIAQDRFKSEAGSKSFPLLNGFKQNTGKRIDVGEFVQPSSTTNIAQDRFKSEAGSKSFPLLNGFKQNTGKRIDVGEFVQPSSTTTDSTNTYYQLKGNSSKNKWKPSLNDPATPRMNQGHPVQQGSPWAKYEEDSKSIPLMRNNVRTGFNKETPTSSYNVKGGSKSSPSTPLQYSSEPQRNARNIPVVGKRYRDDESSTLKTGPLPSKPRSHRKGANKHSKRGVTNSKRMSSQGTYDMATGKSTISQDSDSMSSGSSDGNGLGKMSKNKRSTQSTLYPYQQNSLMPPGKGRIVTETTTETCIESTISSYTSSSIGSVDGSMVPITTTTKVNKIKKKRKVESFDDGSYEPQRKQFKKSNKDNCPTCDDGSDLHCGKVYATSSEIYGSRVKREIRKTRNTRRS